MKPTEENPAEIFASVANQLRTELNLVDSNDQLETDQTMSEADPIESDEQFWNNLGKENEQEYAKVTEQYQKELDQLNSDEQPVVDYNDPKYMLQLRDNHSKEGRYVIKNYNPIEGRKWYEAFSEEDTEIMASILRTLPKEELEQFQKFYATNPEYSQIYWRIIESHCVENKAKKQLSINTLIKHYKNSVRGKKGTARLELRNRFDYQSFTDQMKIVRLFLKGAKTDREWCYSKLLHWWDESLSADLEQAWLRYKDQKCVRTAALRLTEGFIKEHEEAMGELDYKSVSKRLAHDENYVIDKSRLNPLDYCFVIAHNHRHISDQDADQLLFGQIKQLLLNEEHPGTYTDLHPSLYKFKSVRYMVWAFGETGNASTIIKFHLWNKTIQNNLPQYQTEDGRRWIWDDFVNLALHTIPVTLHEENKMESKRIISSRLVLPDGDVVVEIPNIDDELPLIPF